MFAFKPKDIMFSDEILKFIPQRVPFIMVHKVISASENTFITHFEVLEDNIFLNNEILQEPALIENIAQSAAAGFGTLASQNQDGESGGMGFIGSITKLTRFALPKLGDIIETKIEIITQFAGISLIKGTNQVGDKLMLTCEMKIVTGK